MIRLISRQIAVVLHRYAVGCSPTKCQHLPTSLPWTHSQAIETGAILQLSWPCSHSILTSTGEHTSIPLAPRLLFFANGSTFLVVIVFFFGRLGFVSPGPKTSSGRS